MYKTETWIESQSCQSEPRFCLQQRVQIIQHRNWADLLLIAGSRLMATCGCQTFASEQVYEEALWLEIRLVGPAKQPNTLLRLATPKGEYHRGYPSLPVRADNQQSQRLLRCYE